MARKSGSKSSRSERRAGRKRAERAVEHGLPTRQQPPRARPHPAMPELGRNREDTARSSDAPPASVAKSSRIPTLVKVLGVALVILGGVYLLSRQRDEALTEKPAAEPFVVATSATPAVEAVAEPSVSPAPEVTAVPQPPAAVVSVTPPSAPVVAKPVVAKPVVATPAVATPAGAPSVVSAPSKPRVETAPAAPGVPRAVAPTAPAPPVDNPY